MAEVDNLKDKKELLEESVESEEPDEDESIEHEETSDDSESDIEAEEAEEPELIDLLLEDEYFMSTYQECTNLINGTESKSVRDETYKCKISPSNLVARKKYLFTSFLDHKETYLQTAITTINNIDLESNIDPFKILQHDDNEYILDAVSVDDLFEKLKEIRLQKKKLYKSISDETKYTKTKPGNCTTFQELANRILYISQVVNQKIKYFKQTPQKRGRQKTIQNFDRYVLTKKQFQCVLMWFMQYFPSYCFHKMLEINPNYHIKFLFVSAIINQCIFNTRINSFDTNRIEFEPAEEISSSANEEEKDEWIIKTSTEYKNQFCYVISLGSYIVYDSSSIGHLKQILKIGESHSLKNGIKQRFTNHINSNNFMDVTIINIYRASNPKIMEDKLHYKASPYHLNGKLWNKTGTREETELFAFEQIDNITDLLELAARIESQQDHQSREQALEEKVETATATKQTVIAFSQELKELYKKLYSSVKSKNIAEETDALDKIDKFEKRYNEYLESV
jgi:hypothetical protein